MERRSDCHPPRRFFPPVYIVVVGGVVTAVTILILAKNGWLAQAGPLAAGLIGGGASLALLAHLIEQDEGETRTTLFTKDASLTVAVGAVIVTGVSTYGWLAGAITFGLLVLGAIVLVCDLLRLRRRAVSRLDSCGPAAEMESTQTGSETIAQEP